MLNLTIGINGSVIMNKIEVYKWGPEIWNIGIGIDKNAHTKLGGVYELVTNQFLTPPFEEFWSVVLSHPEYFKVIYTHEGEMGYS